MQNSQRIILTPNIEHFVYATSREFGMSATDAKRAFYSKSVDNTTIINMNGSPYRNMLSVASSMIERFQFQVSLPQILSDLNWLTIGSTNVTAAHIVETAGVRNLEEHKKDWLAILRRHADNIPNLSELQSPSDWTAANKKYSTSIVQATANLTAAYLAEKYGFETFNAWYIAAKDTNSAETAFTKVYNISLTQFDDEFKEYLTAQLHPK